MCAHISIFYPPSEDKDTGAGGAPSSPAVGVNGGRCTSYARDGADGREPPAFQDELNSDIQKQYDRCLPIVTMVPLPVMNLDMAFLQLVITLNMRRNRALKLRVARMTNKKCRIRTE
ncbi:unnamed protein product [Linum trigynum]|uniref:Uncharacterized protein n=1 Tax=Linum trigynum TaxID=586398 RepID=A0AAV2DX87_9ROSI